MWTFTGQTFSLLCFSFAGGSVRMTQELAICNVRGPPLNKPRPEISRSNSASRSCASDQSRCSGAGLSRWSGKTSTNQRASSLNKRFTKSVARLVGRTLFMFSERQLKETWQEIADITVHQSQAHPNTAIHRKRYKGFRVVISFDKITRLRLKYNHLISHYLYACVINYLAL